MSRAVMQQALEALEYTGMDVGKFNRVNAACAALRAALAEPQTTHWEGCEAVHPECRKPEQQPVAWMDREGDVYKDLPSPNWCPPHTPLYTAPTPRKPLTEKELDDLRQADGGALNFVTLRAFRVIARAIERAHDITREQA